MRVLKLIFVGIVSWLPAFAQAQQYVVSLVTNPPSSGTITGAGTYANKTTVTLQIRSTPGWYIQHIASDAPPNYIDEHGMNHASPEERFRNAKFIAEAIDPAFDPTTYTTFDPQLYVTGDSTTTVTFAPLSPTFSIQPHSGAFLSGTTVELSGEASGRKTIGYQWQKDGTNLLGKTAANLTLTNAQPVQSGIYTLVASNAFGITSSIPATILISNIMVFADDFPVLSPAIEADNQTRVKLQSAYSNARIYYTLDGSEPDFSKTPYAQPFTVYNNCLLRVIAYKSDFTQSATSGPISIVIHPLFYLSADGYGTLLFNPPGGIYRSNTLVTITAVSNDDWTFVEWQDEWRGTNSVRTILMNDHKTVTPLFVTSVHLTTAGTGAASTYPSLAMHPGGATVWLTGIPGPGLYLKEWSWEKNGILFITERNPANLLIRNPNPTATALFAPIPAGKAYLTVKSEGGGIASVNAGSNLFTIGESCSLNAFAEPGQRFVGWSGNASGTNGSISLLMNSNKTVIAHFTTNATLGINAAGGNVNLSISGYRDVYRIETSTNLSVWTLLATVTNFFDATFSESVPHSPVRMYRAVKQ